MDIETGHYEINPLLQTTSITSDGRRNRGSEFRYVGTVTSLQVVCQMCYMREDTLTTLSLPKLPAGHRKSLGKFGKSLLQHPYLCHMLLPEELWWTEVVGRQSENCDLEHKVMADYR
ncbi:hypothetical protein E2C01_010162 [Portunus trituberculatus]|uniref:Uncharacterized protein n=1 Tax=Portunus trituberculatus TaxID=210409 RepID=A0A5B7D7S9_PORTR|nr:hypothetical protein [Portunus trituberculatus]